MFHLLWIVWSIWVGTTTVSAVRHAPALREGCHFLYQGPRCCAWPLHRTDTVLCWSRGGLIDEATK